LGIASYDVAMRIGGKSVASASHDWIDLVDPSTGRVFARTPSASQAELDAAVGAAVAAFAPWSRTSIPQRQAVMRAIADLLERSGDELIDLEVRNIGKLTPEVRRELQGSLRQFRSLADQVSEFEPHPPTTASGAAVVWVPLGVIGSVIPWNAPMSAMLRRMACTIATGNTLVIKPSQFGSLTPLRINELAEEAGLPPGVVNVVTGPGSTVGRWLARHPGIAKLSFMGGQEAGAEVLRTAAERIVPTVLELGGKSPQVVFDDAELELAVPAVLRGFTRNAGQICTCGTRLLVQETVADQMVERLVTEARAMRVGPASQAGSDMGPLITAGHRAKVDGFVQRAREAGLRPATGGVFGAGDGYFYRPTIFTGVAPMAEIFQEEIFGPVLTVTPFRDYAHAIELANATRYGLVSAVWTRDLEKAVRAATDIDAGACWINGYWSGPTDLSRGSRRKSGFGALDFGVEGLREFLSPKQISIAGNISHS
jgi:acyl-CoA reductase-like NAD-dependent aldehyde dehydrogenase